MGQCVLYQEAGDVFVGEFITLVILVYCMILPVKGPGKSRAPVRHGAYKLEAATRQFTKLQTILLSEIQTLDNDEIRRHAEHFQTRLYCHNIEKDYLWQGKS